jgi:vacuolar-type H+-ATPase subunit I/STV1
MLRPTRMKRIQILALEVFRYEVVKRLQELGSVHLTDYSERLSNPSLKDLLSPHLTSPNIRKIAAQNIAVNRLLDLFGRYDPEPKTGFIKGVFAPTPPKKIETREIYGRALIEAVDHNIEQIEREVGGPVKELEGIEEEIVELERIKGLLCLVLPLEVDLTNIGESDFLTVFLGAAPKEEIDTIEGRLEELTEGHFYLGVSDSSEHRAVMLIVCLREQAQLVVANLRRLNWERIDQGKQ